MPEQRKRDTMGKVVKKRGRERGIAHTCNAITDNAGRRQVGKSVASF